MVVYSLGSFYDFQLTQDERLSVDDFMNGVSNVYKFKKYFIYLILHNTMKPV